MKRNSLFKVCLLVILTLLFITGCQGDEKQKNSTEYHAIDYDNIDFANERAKYAKREKELVVLTEENLKREIDSIALWYMRSQDEVKITIEVLAEDETQRENQLQKMRTKIMAGEGPDVYIMDIQNELTDESDEKASLFANVNKTIESGVFETLTSYMETDSYWKEQPMEDAFLKAGQMDEQQYVLPLSCDYYVLAGINVDEPNLGDNIMEWLSYINVTDDDTIKNGCSMLTMQSARLFQPAIDYQNKSVTIQKEEWISYMAELLVPYRKAWYVMDKTGERGYCAWSIQQVMDDMQGFINEDAEKYNFCKSIPGLEGECKATVRTWGAVGKNSEYKQEAYDFLMLFLNNKVTKDEYAGVYYNGVDECVGVDGIPTQAEVLEQYMERKKISKEQQELVLSSFEQINVVYFPTEVESLVQEKVEEALRGITSDKSESDWRLLFTEIADMAEEKYSMIAKE